MADEVKEEKKEFKDYTFYEKLNYFKKKWIIYTISEYSVICLPFIILLAVKWKDWTTVYQANSFSLCIGAMLCLIVMALVFFKKGKFLKSAWGYLIITMIVILLQSILSDLGLILEVGAIGVLGSIPLRKQANKFYTHYKGYVDKVAEETRKNVPDNLYVDEHGNIAER